MTRFSPTLKRWLADEDSAQRRRNESPGAGVALTDQIAGKSGLEVMQAMLAGDFPYAAMAETLHYLLVEVGAGTATFQGKPQAGLLNSIGSVHGGWYATLLDSALGCAVYTVVPVGQSYTTAQLNVNIIRSVSLDVPRVRAEGHVIHCGRKMATAEARLIGPDGTLYAHGTTTCLILTLS